MITRLLTGHTAIEVSGVDLTASVSDGLRSDLIDAFHRHLVLVIRDQNLDPQQMLDAVHLVGDVFTQHKKMFWIA
ncbi:uncharacterized protein METZ01_LOCUS457400 [marine metagenome]|uniref:Uncharacterized protein n=1 Tax=marine metagenome TaxID=408172 RepID=A0A383A9K1_9ZZZZ